MLCYGAAELEALREGIFPPVLLQRLRHQLRRRLLFSSLGVAVWIFLICTVVGLFVSGFQESAAIEIGLVAAAITASALYYVRSNTLEKHLTNGQVRAVSGETQSTPYFQKSGRTAYHLKVSTHEFEITQSQYELFSHVASCTSYYVTINEHDELIAIDATSISDSPFLTVLPAKQEPSSQAQNAAIASVLGYDASDLEAARQGYMTRALMKNLNKTVRRSLVRYSFGVASVPFLICTLFYRSVDSSRDLVALLLGLVAAMVTAVLVYFARSYAIGTHVSKLDLKSVSGPVTFTQYQSTNIFSSYRPITDSFIGAGGRNFRVRRSLFNAVWAAPQCTVFYVTLDGRDELLAVYIPDTASDFVASNYGQNN